MILDKEIDIDGALIDIKVDYQYYKENGLITIAIDSIMSGSMDMAELISSAEYQNIVDDCQTHYENHKFNEIEKVFNRIHYGIEDNLDTEV